MFLVYVLDCFSRHGRLFGSLNVSCKDVGCKNKPNATVVVLREVTSHLHDFYIVHLLDVVAHLKTLLHAVVSFETVSYHCYLISIGAKVVSHLTLTSLLVSHGRIGSEFNNDWLSNPCLGFNTCLHVANPPPLFT